MSREKDPECRGVLIRETDGAILVAKSLAAQSAEFWIPRSQIGYLRKTKREGGEAVDVVFTAPEWLIEKKQCWELVP
jgi:hypothetical protein